MRTEWSLTIASREGSASRRERARRAVLSHCRGVARSSLSHNRVTSARLPLCSAAIIIESHLQTILHAPIKLSSHSSLSPIYCLIHCGRITKRALPFRTPSHLLLCTSSASHLHLPLVHHRHPSFLPFFPLLKALSHLDVLASVCRRMKKLSKTLAHVEYVMGKFCIR